MTKTVGKLKPSSFLLVADSFCEAAYRVISIPFQDERQIELPNNGLPFIARAIEGDEEFTRNWGTIKGEFLTAECAQ